MQGNRFSFLHNGRHTLRLDLPRLVHTEVNHAHKARRVALRIFIDESGTFGRAKTGPSISVVGALVLPDYRWIRIQRKYAALRANLPQQNGEVKGRLLSELHIADVVELLRSNDALFWAAAIDLSLHSDDDIKTHQMGQARGITNSITPRHHPSLQKEISELRSSLEALAPQLYVQSVLMFELIHRALCEATLYFCQRQPKELAGFHWEIDAKDRETTKWEEWWTKVALPILQSKSESDPWPHLSPEGDYSFMKRFEVPVPAWARRPPKDGEPQDFQQVAWNTRLILNEDFRFASDTTPGLELVDILVNAVRRALVGNLLPKGFAPIASLMTTNKKQCLHLLCLSKANLRRRKTPYDQVILEYFKTGGRSMLLPRRL